MTTNSTVPAFCEIDGEFKSIDTAMADPRLRAAVLEAAKDQAQQANRNLRDLEQYARQWDADHSPRPQIVEAVITEVPRVPRTVRVVVTEKVTKIPVTYYVKHSQK